MKNENPGFSDVSDVIRSVVGRSVQNGKGALKADSTGKLQVEEMNGTCLPGEAGLAQLYLAPILPQRPSCKQRLSSLQHQESLKHLAILPALPSKVTHIGLSTTPYQDTLLRLHLSSPPTQPLALEKTPPLPQWPPSMSVTMVYSLGNQGVPPSVA